MFNPVIIAAIIIQAIISWFSRLASAIVGLIITTGILFWGLSLYTQGDQIAFFSIPISQAVFILSCIIWYGVDILLLIAAIENLLIARNFVLNKTLLENEDSINFYKYTMQVWGEGTLDILRPSFKREGNLKYNDFLKLYGPYKGCILETFFINFKPFKNEFLFEKGDKIRIKSQGCFLLTNLRFILRDITTDSYIQVLLEEIESVNFITEEEKQVIINLKSGQNVKLGTEKTPHKDIFNFAFELFRKSAITQNESTNINAEVHIIENDSVHDYQKSETNNEKIVVDDMFSSYQNVDVFCEGSGNLNRSRISIFLDEDFKDDGSFSDGFKMNIKAKIGNHILRVAWPSESIFDKGKSECSLEIEKGFDYKIYLKLDRWKGGYKFNVQKILLNK